MAVADPRLLRQPLTVLTALRSPRQLTREVLAGMVTTLALVPEVISFSIVAGVDPMVSLVASIVLALAMSVLGGRPGVVTAAAGSVALVIAPLVHDHGVQYVLPTVLLAGVIQVVFGLAGLARLMRFIPRSVMIGFVNALGVLIFMAQVPHVINVPWLAYVLFAVTLAIIFILPVTTIDWHSVKPSTLKRMPIPETLVMAVTVAVVVLTDNLAYGVLVGVVLAMVLFARRVAHVISVNRSLADDGGSVRYEVVGPLFFGSSNDLVGHFAYADDPASVTIDLSRAQIWDASTVAALDSIETKYEAHGATVTIEGLDERSTGFHRRLSGYLGT